MGEVVDIVDDEAGAPVLDMLGKAAAVTEDDCWKADTHCLDRRVAEGFLGTGREHKDVEHLKVISNMLLLPCESNALADAKPRYLRFEALPCGAIANDITVGIDTRAGHCLDQQLGPFPVAQVGAGADPDALPCRRSDLGDNLVGCTLRIEQGEVDTVVGRHDGFGGNAEQARCSNCPLVGIPRQRGEAATQIKAGSDIAEPLARRVIEDPSPVSVVAPKMLRARGHTHQADLGSMEMDQVVPLQDLRYTGSDRHIEIVLL